MANGTKRGKALWVYWLLLGTSLAGPSIGCHSVVRQERLGPSSERPLSPGIDLDQVRFCMYEEGMFFCELQSDYARIWEAYPELEADAVDIVPFTDWLPSEVQNEVFERIAEQKGDLYTLFFLPSMHAAKARLTGLAPRFQGAGTYSGFVGILAADETDYSDGADLPILAWPDAEAHAGLFIAAIPPLPEAPELIEAQEELDRADGVEVVRVTEVQALYREYPVQRMLLMVAENARGQKNLYCMEDRNGGYRIVPFRSLKYAIPAPGGGILFEHSKLDGEMGYFFGDSRIYVLPDLNGDGSSEFLLDSVATILFSVRSEEGAFTHGSRRAEVVEVRGISFAS